MRVYDLTQQNKTHQKHERIIKHSRILWRQDIPLIKAYLMD